MGLRPMSLRMLATWGTSGSGSPGGRWRGRCRRDGGPARPPRWSANGTTVTRQPAGVRYQTAQDVVLDAVMRRPPRWQAEGLGLRADDVRRDDSCSTVWRSLGLGIRGVLTAGGEIESGHGGNLAPLFDKLRAVGFRACESTPRMTPRVRRWRTRARVSRSLTMGTPARVRKTSAARRCANCRRWEGKLADHQAFDVRALGRNYRPSWCRVIADLRIGPGSPRLAG